MKKSLSVVLLSLCAMISGAQTEQDPIVLVVAGESVPRSEFEYSYNKNNGEGVIDKKSVEEYVDLFVNYKLKVKAAADAKIDTLTSFREEYASYRDQQIRPALLDDDDIEREAQRIYKETQQEVDGAGGIVKPAHIFLSVPQQTTDADYQRALQRADSIYNVLKENNFDSDLFGTLVEQYSQDISTMKTKGEFLWIRRGVLLPELDDKVFSMEVGETSTPVRAADGIHILQLRGRQHFPPYDSLRTEIHMFIDRRGVREALIDQKLDSLAAAQGQDVTRADILRQKREEMVSEDEDLKYLLKEYHDGLMLYEISNATVWDKAEKDSTALAQYYKKNKKRYRWDAPRFKGIAYRTKETADIANVKAALEGVPFDKWVEVLRTTFNADSVQIRAEKGIFRRGDNALVDKYVFAIDSVATDDRYASDYPYTSTYGRLIAQPEDYGDVRGLVVGDYQEELERAWVAALRRKYPVVVDRAVLATVNNH